MAVIYFRTLASEVPSAPTPLSPKDIDWSPCAHLDQWLILSFVSTLGDLHLMPLFSSLSQSGNPPKWQIFYHVSFSNGWIGWISLFQPSGTLTFVTSLSNFPEVIYHRSDRSDTMCPHNWRLGFIFVPLELQMTSGQCSTSYLDFP